LHHLPSAPRVLPKLKRLLSDGNSSIHEVVTLIRLDPGIAARVLQMGNSAYFGQGARCYTLDDAISRVGFDQVYELVAVAVSSEVLVRPLTTYGIDADELWSSSVSCAIAAEVLAERAGLDRDLAYTVGLLHRVGLVAINEWAARHAPALRIIPLPVPGETSEAERLALGFHNGEAGAALLKHWEFPAAMTEPVRWQYSPRATAAFQQLASLVQLAKWLRTILQPGESCAAPESTALAALKIRSSMLPSLADEAGRRVAAVSHLLADTPKDPVSLPFPGAERQVAGY
jgi:HD-like signal output (HDOD) protein